MGIFDSAKEKVEEFKNSNADPVDDARDLGEKARSDERLDDVQANARERL